ncbi:hypothetical protein LTR10_015158 [Elasticomyces elasticus]|uniref:Transcription factor domain-containing protein n=1 Tax=Exophiala sideris TaxID=1016849 RepID=A0ABR0JEB6_9EURO|nr:hypothetical protein LTR10_015158 [Elasticomyces elasticus]KAK5032631.1 hypothetical protein LTS07_004041 [Exophiala sideris]KAK5037188.1 hypothetical protein LTR13_004993 [Exophiala sideris]KAK5062156.1 hypothetical protein LTR69_004514 [Exophiala sideris]KAK5182346.1 hypothetical protein LTR44_005357 [Eurotiomycetes sp. CCFEE 6388]
MSHAARKRRQHADLAIRTAHRSTGPGRREGCLGQPTMLLSQSKRDPFCSFPMSNKSPLASACLEYAYRDVYPPLLLQSTQSRELVSVEATWRRIGLEWPLMFHLQVAGALNVVRVHTGFVASAQSEIMRLKHQNQGLSMLMSILHGLRRPPSDALIMAMVIAGMLCDTIESPVARNEPVSPIAMAQNLHIFGRLAMVPATLGALVSMIDRRGGLEKVTGYGMLGILQFTDLLLASRTSSPPVFACVAAVYRLPGEEWRPDQQAMQMWESIGQGFDGIVGLDKELLQVLGSMCEVTVALDHYQHRRERAHAPALRDILGAVNVTQHELLSHLKPKTVNPKPVQSICHEAALIYSDFVMFPLPQCCGVRSTAARRLLIVIEQLEKDDAQYSVQANDDGVSPSPPVAALLMWALVLGTLAASDDLDKRYYQLKLIECLKLSDVRCWNEFQNTIRTFLWWDYMFTDRVAELWEEVGHNVKP